jgi:hypothetical protein
MHDTGGDAFVAAQNIHAEHRNCSAGSVRQPKPHWQFSHGGDGTPALDGGLKSPKLDIRDGRVVEDAVATAAFNRNGRQSSRLVDGQSQNHITLKMRPPRRHGISRVGVIERPNPVGHGGFAALG